MAEEQTSSAGSSRFKSLGIRAISGIALICICLLPVYFGGWPFAILVGIFGVRMVYEWVRMSEGNITAPTFVFQAIVLISVLILGVLGYWKFALGAAFIGAALAAFERLRRGGSIWALFGVLYVALPCLAIIWLRGNMVGFDSSGFAKLIFVMFAVIAADTFAYLGGSMIKGPKMAPRISPNKTWSGFFSGLIMGGVFGAIVAYFAGFSPLTGALFALPVVVFSVLGDLLESAIKRHLKVKDAGGLLPGHGGILDRVDSLMLAVLFAAGVLMIWPGIWPVT